MAALKPRGENIRLFEIEGSNSKDDYGMTDTEAEIIEMVRKLARLLLSNVTAKGVQPVDATIALNYALHDAATQLTGDPFAAIEWMRTATDAMERQVMEGSYAATEI